MAFQIIRNDITKVEADAIVNSANPRPQYVSGTDAAIYKAAGAEELLEARRKRGDIAVGEARATEAFALKAKYIIHTVGPAWWDGRHGETEAVKRCYENSLKLAEELGCESIAFPLIATGVYGFPKAEALKIAISVFSEHLLTSDIRIILVVFDEEAFVLSGKIFSDVEAFIDGGTVADRTKEEYANCPPGGGMIRKKEKEKSLEELVKKPGETWQESLFRLIDERSLTDTEVYKRANVDRKLFSKIRSNREYQPKKSTAVSFALSLGLDMDETREFLSKAGYALSRGNRFDLIVEYFIGRGVYDPYTINLALFEHGQQLLGA